MPERLRAVSSRQNALVKDLRRGFTQSELTAEGLWAIEGVRLIEEAIRSGLKVHALLFSKSGEGRAQRLLPQLSGKAEVLSLPDEVFRSAVETESPQGVAALIKARPAKLEDIFTSATPLIAVAAGVQDPGNLGTMARSAEAFGATGLLLASKTVSHYNSKAVRSSAGSLFRLPAIHLEDGEALAELRKRNVRLIGTASHKGAPLNEADLTGAVAICIGNEGAGLSRELAREMEQLITIPHSARVESLNAGVAASIVFYEAARQRRSQTS